MRGVMAKTTLKLVSIGLAGAVMVTSPVPSLAQDGNAEARLRKIESEIRALQRTVFPGGDGRFFEPQVSPGERVVTTSGVPSTTAVTDILARLDALELQMQRITALSEENTNALNQMEVRLAALEALPQTQGPTQSEESGGPEAVELGGANTDNLDAMMNAQAGEQETDTTPTVAGPTAERLEAVQAITKPQTDDPADDEYSYGFRLWNAGFYPEARQQLSSFVEDYPSHWRTTYGRNLLGRAYLDDGLPEQAARWFLTNYRTDRQAARAPDSLLYLAESMIALDDVSRACIALSEFADTYPAVATGRLADQYESNRQKVTCNG